ncbi:MAG: AMP-binding protein, partial [Bacteroidota bacterium]
VYVPLDPKAPAERTRFLIEDCDIATLISHRSQKRNLLKVLAGGTALQHIIGGPEEEEGVQSMAWSTLARQPVKFQPPFPILESDLAYIMYTSGSTGRPKGIMHTHASGLAYARLSADLFGLKENDVIGNHAPIFFDISTLGYFTGPLVGGTTVIATDAHTIFPASLAKLIETERITVWYSVPLAVVQMLQSGALTKVDWSALRWLLYGGEPFPPKYLREIMTLYPALRCCNVYGPAEVNQCTYYHVPGPPQDELPVPIGEVWNNTERIILDDNEEELLGPGTGELAIRSATMMQGYWKQPQLTEHSLYKKEGPGGTKAYFYKTGDLVRLDEKDVLHFLGRKDHQVKIRGHRVELDAVEAALVGIPAVLEAAAFPMQTDGTALTIAAAVVLRSGEDTDEKALMHALQQKLPVYAIPTTIVILEDFPRTGSGKIKRSEIKLMLTSKN